MPLLPAGDTASTDYTSYTCQCIAGLPPSSRTGERVETNSLTQTASHRFLLVRCRLLNPNGQTSVRYVEHHLFRLWQYVMANRHGLTVQDANLCLWLPEEQWSRQADYFRAAGPNEAVDLLSIELFDAEHQLWERVQRFVASEDASACVERLLGRVPARLRGGDNMQHRIIEGNAVAQGGYANLQTLGHCFDDEAEVDALDIHIDTLQ